MKLNFLETHDRYQHLLKNDFDISKSCQNIIDEKPYGNHPFYIFAHARTSDDGIKKRLIWQPRLTKPKAQTNSMLFKAYPGTDLIKVIWMIPARELWGQYKKENMMENPTVSQSIHDFLYNRNRLEEMEEDDLSDDQIHAIYREISIDAKRQKHINEIYNE